MKILILALVLSISTLEALPAIKAKAASIPMQKRVTIDIATFALIPSDPKRIEALSQQFNEEELTIFKEIEAITLPLIETLQKYQLLIWNSKGALLENEEAKQILEENPNINMLAPVIGFLSYASNDKTLEFLKHYRDAMTKMRQMKQESNLAKSIVSVNSVMDIIHDNVNAEAKLQETFFCL